MNKLIPIIIIIVLLSLAIAFFAIYRPEIIPNPDIGRNIPVSQVRVISGHEFIVRLSDDSYLNTVLVVNSVPEAHREVVRLFNSEKVAYPSIVLLEELDNSWVVDILFEYEGRNTTLTEWLLNQNLTSGKTG